MSNSFSPRAVLSSLIAEGKAQHVKTSRAQNNVANSSDPFSRDRVQSLRRSLKVSAQLAASMQRLGQIGFEKVAMVETAEAGSSPVPGPMSNGSPDAVSNSGQSISDTTNGQPTRIEMARATAGDLSLDQGNLDSISGPVVAGGPMPTVEGPDNTYAAIASEAANAVTKESAARVLRKLANGRKFSNNRAAYSAAKRLNIHDSSTALFILTKSASVRGKSMTEFLQGMDLRNHNRANYFREMAVNQTSNLLRKYAEAGIIGPMGAGLELQELRTRLKRWFVLTRRCLLQTSLCRWLKSARQPLTQH
jgi:hypothetical protein